MEQGFEEFSTVELGIPSLSVKRTKLPNGGFRASVTVTKAVWDKEKKRPATGPSRNVGVVANDQEYGPIVFKESFLNEFPQIRSSAIINADANAMSRQRIRNRRPRSTIRPARWDRSQGAATDACQAALSARNVSYPYHPAIAPSKLQP